MSIITPTATKPPESDGLDNSLRVAFQHGIVLVDSQDKLSVCTPAARRLLRLTPRARNFEDLPVEIQTMITKARSDGKPLIDQSINLIDTGSRTKDLRISILPAGSDNALIPVTLVLQDLSSNLDRNLQQLDRLANFGTLSAGLAHEIKNALVVGKTFFDLLLEKDRDAELVQLVRRELKRIESLVTQMVRYNTPAKPKFAEMKMHEVLNHSLLMVERQLKDKTIELERDYFTGLDLVKGDDFQLEQAFVNLLLNAVDAMGPGGRLKVMTRVGSNDSDWSDSLPPARPDQFEVRIQDNGMGISPENIDRLFDPFFTTKIVGTGLGLPITRRIVEQHGGFINVTSRPDAGTCFQILLPCLEMV